MGDFNSTHHILTNLSIENYNFFMSLSGIFCGFMITLILLLFVVNLK